MHFRVALSLPIKAKRGARPFMKMSLICILMKPHFHYKRGARRFALRKRLKVIRKWPIEQLMFDIVLNIRTEKAYNASFLLQIVYAKPSKSHICTEFIDHMHVHR